MVLGMLGSAEGVRDENMCSQAQKTIKNNTQCPETCCGAPKQTYHQVKRITKVLLLRAHRTEIEKHWLSSAKGASESFRGFGLLREQLKHTFPKGSPHFP